MAVPTGTRTASLLAAQTFTVAVAWALAPGDPGYGAAGVTQSGTATYSITVPAGNVPEGIFNLIDTLDAGTRGANAFITVT
jgi:hypothetical protein